jgi:hypothetical protein
MIKFQNFWLSLRHSENFRTQENNQTIEKSSRVQNIKSCFHLDISFFRKIIQILEQKILSWYLNVGQYSQDIET